MKKILKGLGWLLLGLLLLVSIGAAFIHFNGIPKFEPGNVSLKVDVTPARVERGQKIAAALCIECHMGESGSLTGKTLMDVPLEFGTIRSRNITHHPEIGIGKWTDGELYYLLRTGIKRDGQYIPPYMVKFPLASEEDIFDIIAWLRSDSPGLAASEEEAPESEPSFLTKFLCHVAFKPLPLKPDAIAPPDTSNPVAHGKYLVQAIYHCNDCHSKDFKTNNDLEPEKSEGFCGGGNPLLNKEGEVIKSANITFDETGLASYSLEDFTRVLHEGRRKNGNMIRYPMIPYPRLTDQEINAIYSYLKTVPKIKNTVGS